MRRTLEALAVAARALFGFVPFVLNLALSFALGRKFRRRLARLLAEREPVAVDDPPAPGECRKVYVLAGEESGDLHAANLVRALRSLDPAVEVRGMGGPRLEAAGATLDHDLVSMSVMGVWPVLRSVGTYFGLYRRLLRMLDSDPPDVLVPVDYPGLNLRVARAARRRGVKVAYYIAPQVWAWAPWRLRRIARCVDRVLAILPFEREMYARGGVPCAFVGHPLYEHLERTAPCPAGRERGEPRVLGILPGSRRSEVRSLLPAMLRAAREALAVRPGLRLVLPYRGARIRAEIDAILARDAAGLEVRVSEGRTHEEMREMDVALVASGTASLELAYYGVPMVVLYRLSRVASLLRRFVLITPHVALVNIVAGRRIVPEFVRAGDLAVPASEAPRRWIGDPRALAEVRSDLEEVRGRLLFTGSAERAAAWVRAAPRGRSPSADR